MRVQLIFPPQWAPHMPYLSLPALTGYLRARGIDCHQLDLNLESFERMLSPGYLEACGATLQNRIEAIEARERVDSGLASTYRQLTAAAVQLPAVLDRVAAAVETIRSPDSFYHLDRHDRSYAMIGKAFSIISLAHHPSVINFREFIASRENLNLTRLRTIAGDRSINPYLSMFEDEFIPRLLADRPDLVGLSVISDCQLAPAFTLIRSLRRFTPDLCIVVGGPFFGKLEDRLHRNPDLFDEVDAFVLGPGEEPLHQLCQALEAGRRLDTVPNLVHRDGEGRVRTSEKRAAVRARDLPTPCFDELPLERYFSGEPVLPLLVSHGCYWNKCRFCGSFHIYGRRFQPLPAERVVEDMKTLHRRHGVIHFNFADEALPPAAARGVAELIHSERLPFRWFSEARFEKTFDNDLCVILARGGCVKLKFGLESGSQRVLNLMKKGTDLAVADRVIAACLEAGIAVHFFCMVGFPGETEADFEETRQFFLDRPHVVTSSGFSFYSNVYVLDIGSEAAGNSRDLGIETIRTPGDDELSVLLDFSTSALPAADVLERRNWDLIRTVGEMIGSPREPGEEAGQFLYLAHFDGNPPPAAPAEPSPAAAGTLEPGAVPTPAPGLAWRRIVRFADDDSKPAADEPADLIPRSHSWIASTANSPTANLLPAESMEILRLCDGRRWEEVVDVETRRTDGDGDGPPRTPASRAIRNRRLFVLEDLLLKGFLQLSPGPDTGRVKR